MANNENPTSACTVRSRVYKSSTSSAGSFSYVCTPVLGEFWGEGGGGRRGDETSVSPDLLHQFVAMNRQSVDGTAADALRRQLPGPLHAQPFGTCSCRVHLCLRRGESLSRKGTDIACPLAIAKHKLTFSYRVQIGQGNNFVTLSNAVQ